MNEWSHQSKIAFSHFYVYQWSKCNQYWWEVILSNYSNIYPEELQVCKEITDNSLTFFYCHDSRQVK